MGIHTLGTLYWVTFVYPCESIFHGPHMRIIHYFIRSWCNCIPFTFDEHCGYTETSTQENAPQTFHTQRRHSIVWWHWGFLEWCFCSSIGAYHALPPLICRPNTHNYLITLNAYMLIQTLRNAPSSMLLMLYLHYSVESLILWHYCSHDWSHEEWYHS